MATKIEVQEVKLLASGQDLRQQTLIDAVNRAKKSEFGATGIKVELEANLRRGNDGDDGDDYCDGTRYCPQCDGEWDHYCCDDEDCEENYTCDYCDEGYTDCDGDCGRRHSGDEQDDSNWNNVSVCQDWILERLVPFGLAERMENGSYKPAGALVFAKFYRDGSVDSEFTFTLSLKNPEDVLLLPKVVEIFKQLGEEIGNGIEVEGAGMHMAWINSGNCFYPTDTNSDDEVRFSNFAKSMRLLLPALYFLGAANESSRGLSFRPPVIRNDKYSAITYRYGAIEYRVFDTCYDNPEQVLDNMVVMSNSLRYWTSKYKPSGVEKVSKGCKFGNDNDSTLMRFYTTTEHITLLNEGLARLKPRYYSIRQIKEQRKFKVTKATVKSQERQQRKQAQLEYAEYVDRFEFKLKAWEAQMLGRELEKAETRVQSGEFDSEKLKAQVNEKVQQYISDESKNKKSLSKYVEDKVRDFVQRSQGQYELRA